MAWTRNLTLPPIPREKWPPHSLSHTLFIYIHSSPHSFWVFLDFTKCSPLSSPTSLNTFNYTVLQFLMQCLPMYSSISVLVPYWPWNNFSAEIGSLILKFFFNRPEPFCFFSFYFSLPVLLYYLAWECWFLSLYYCKYYRILILINLSFFKVFLKEYKCTCAIHIVFLLKLMPFSFLIRMKFIFLFVYSSIKCRVLWWAEYAPGSCIFITQHPFQLGCITGRICTTGLGLLRCPMGAMSLGQKPQIQGLQAHVQPSSPWLMVR